MKTGEESSPARWEYEPKVNCMTKNNADYEASTNHTV
jgi:hypothetical protein